MYVCASARGSESGAKRSGGREREERRRREVAMEGSVATRKVRVKRFVECFMESFRIVDFLSPGSIRLDL